MDLLETSHEAYALLATAARQTVHQEWKQELRQSESVTGNERWKVVFQKEFLRKELW